MDTEINKVLSTLGFKVIRNISKGPYATVKLAESEKYPNPVAIKIINKDKSSQRDLTKYLKQELSILRKVKHPHIVEVHEILEMPDQVYIVMETSEMDLYQKVYDELHCVPVDQAKVWFSQILSATDYLHQNDIAHRNIKLDNVLLMSDGRVKLADFGLGCFSKGYPDLKRRICGNPYYCPPEMFGRKIYDAKKKDIWSLGVLFYVMVTGSLPFNSSKEDIILLLQHKPLKYPEGVTEDTRAFISYMLNTDYVLRPSVEKVAKHPFLHPDQKK